jgi:phosphatidate cytidylyltransferase
MDQPPSAAPHMTPDVAPRKGRDLVAATAVGLVLAALLATALVLPPWALTALVGLLLVAAHLELGAILDGLDRPVHTDVLVAATVVLLLATHLAGASGQAAGLAVLTVLALLRSLADRSRRDVLGTVARTVLLGAWLTGLASFALLLRAGDAPVVALATVLGAAAAGDIAAYFVGSRIGKRPLAPTVSPNKTWEGVVGGLAAAAVVGAAVLPLDGSSTMLRGASIGIAVGVAALLGDLVASMIKRDLGVKDLGRLLPGHGGVLDRVDGLLLALPAGHALLVLLP